MLGKQSDQRGIWEADSLYIDHVGRGSFYGLLASLRGQLFRDEEFGGCTVTTTAGRVCYRACWRRRCFFRLTTG